MPITKADIRKVMRGMPFISVDGCASGFYNVMPLGLWAERCMNHLTNVIRRGIQVHRVSFPLAFPANHPHIQKLIHQFDKRDEIFHMRDEPLALSYSPDPNLLLWLANKKIAKHHLPYAIETHSIFLRKIKSGGINGIDRVRQFAFPGIFMLNAKQEAGDNVWLFLKLASQIMNNLFHDRWKTKITVCENFYHQNKNHFDGIETATGQRVEIKFVSEQTRYFAYKLGLYANAGYADLMIFNLQWDNTNPGIFNISTDQDELIILHATLAGAINRVYPALIAQGLEKKVNVFSPLVAPYQVGVVFDKNNQNKAVIQSLSDIFEEKNIRHYHAKAKKFHDKVAEVDQLWAPYIIIVPSDANCFDHLKIFDRTQNKARISFPSLVEKLCSIATTDYALFHNQADNELPF